MTKAVRRGIHTGLVMESPDWNQTLLLAVGLLGSLTQLVRLLFGALRVCVREYYEFRHWMRALARDTRRSEEEADKGVIRGS